MPVYKLCEMPYEEFLGWLHYFKMRPADWREDQRTYMLLSAQGVKKKPEEIFASLQAIKENKPERSQAESLRNSGFLTLLRAAAKKNNVEWDLDDSKN